MVIFSLLFALSFMPADGLDCWAQYGGTIPYKSTCSSRHTHCFRKECSDHGGVYKHCTSDANFCESASASCWYNTVMVSCKICTSYMCNNESAEDDQKPKGVQCPQLPAPGTPFKCDVDGYKPGDFAECQCDEAEYYPVGRESRETLRCSDDGHWEWEMSKCKKRRKCLRGQWANLEAITDSDELIGFVSVVEKYDTRLIFCAEGHECLTFGCQNQTAFYIIGGCALNNVEMDDHEKLKPFCNKFMMDPIHEWCESDLCNDPKKTRSTNGASNDSKASVMVRADLFLVVCMIMVICWWSD